MEAEGRSVRDEQRQRIRLQGSQKKASKGTDSAPGKAGGEGPMATPPGEPQLLTTQARRWQQRGAGLPAPGTPRERGAVPSSARRKPQPVEQEGARGGRAGGRRRGEMPRRVLCMLSSPRRSIWHGWLSARAGPACPGERSLSAGLLLPISPRAVGAQQPPAPRGWGLHAPLGPRSRGADGGGPGRAALGMRVPKPHPRPSAGCRAAQRGLGPATIPLLMQKEQHRLTPHPPHPSRAACTLQTSPRAASNPGPSIPSTRRAAPAAFPFQPQPRRRPGSLCFKWVVVFDS